jgi:TRAP-type mannitol/chloroaromatic compound transport system substrate-binding protein
METMMTTRRHLVAGAVAAAAGAFAAPALAQGLRELRMVTAWPKDLTGVGVGAQRLADRIGTLTGGRLTVSVHSVGTLVPPQETMEAVMDGRAEMAHDMAAYNLSRSTGFAFFSSVPFGLTAQEHNAWVYDGGGQVLWDELNRRFGLRAFLAGNTGAQLGGWFRREIGSVGDLAGLKFRVTGIAGQVMAKLGVNQVLLPGGEISAGFLSGTLDGAEFMGPVNDLAFRFHDGAKFYYWPGFHEPCAAIQLQVNGAVFDGLPADQRAAIECACAEENGRLLADYNARTPGALADLLAKGVILKQFSPEIFQAFGAAAGAVLAEISEQEDDLVRRIAHSYFAFRDGTLLWTRIGDQGFANMRLLEYGYPKGA